MNLAIEGGATRARLGLYDDNGTCVREAEGPGANPSLMGADLCAARLCRMALDLLPEPPDTVAASLAGAARADLRDRVARILGQRLGAHRVLVTDDLRPLLLANAPEGPALAVVAGTGSCVLARDASGRTLQVGGLGRFMGDEGGACGIALAALRAAARVWNGCDTRETGLPDALATAAGLRSFAELPAWTEQAGKAGLAALARVVTAAADRGDTLAVACLRNQAEELADQAAAAARRLGLSRDTVVLLAGGMFDGYPPYRDLFRACLGCQSCGSLSVAVPRVRGHAAAATLFGATPVPEGVSVWEGEAAPDEALPPTEQRQDEAVPLDLLDPLSLVLRMSREDHRAAEAVGQIAEDVAAVIAAVADRISRGGRLIYLGAGTSGRLGVLDASECPPTFGVDPRTVVGIIAGGEAALRNSVEGAEDDPGLARADLDALDPPLTHDDAVVGIAASGTTPYVLGGLAHARFRGAHTALVCCNPAVRADADTVIALDTGPEALAGSTRLKAGTATKMVLNMITTGALALSGYVHDGLMVCVRPLNDKLRLRCVRIVAALAEVDAEQAEEAFRSAGEDIRTAVLMLNRKIGADDARTLLLQSGGRLREALDAEPNR
jgi:N-acetylmuramic acid 6-phosphate etherase